MEGKKGIISIISATIFILIAGVFIMSGGSQPESAEALGDIQGVKIDPAVYELGDILLRGGIVTKEYKVFNETDKTIKLKKIATSCMCTKAKIKIGNKETKLFGMEGHGDKNPPVNLEFPARAEALVTVEFDPYAHGPQGVGPLDRSVYLTFSDPGGIKELKFNGVVVAN